MRSLPIVILVLCGAVCLARPPQTRPRATRGFKNVALSTARGFGKRDGLQLQQPRLKAEWLANELTNNPQLAGMFVRRFLDVDSDGFISPNELLATPH
ncbi:allatotropins [Halyomorpha halys]|uniref:allatotropins n=1 Tax=Halyomorpha halys TaxID=286706 RepID=UPI0006D4F104|nr:allatotropin-like [Halyomorpha halys]